MLEKSTILDWDLWLSSVFQLPLEDVINRSNRFLIIKSCIQDMINNDLEW